MKNFKINKNSVHLLLVFLFLFLIFYKIIYYYNSNQKFGIIIGDSIAEGYPYSLVEFSILNQKYILPNFFSEDQIAFHLEKRLEYKVINLGISGQTSDEVRKRWNSDVLSFQDKNLNKNLYFVIIIVGINDIIRNIPAKQIISNLDWMINSCTSNNIYPIVFNIAPFNNINAKQTLALKEVNKWLFYKKSINTKLYLVDFYNYVKDSDNNGKPKDGILIDGLHPNKETYKNLAEKVYQKILVIDKSEPIDNNLP